MKFNGILTLVVTVLVVVLISTAAIIPIVQAAQEEQTTVVQNTGAYYVASPGIPSTGLEFVINVSGDKVVVNDYEFDLSGYGFLRTPIIVSDSFIVTATAGGTPSVGYLNFESIALNLNTLPISISIASDGTYTVTSGDSSDSGTCTKIVYASDKGTLGYFPNSGSVWIDHDKPYYIVGNMWGNSIVKNVSAFIEMNDGTPTVLALASALEMTLSSVTVSTVEEGELADKYTSPSVVIGYVDNDTPATITMSGGFLAPIDYTTISENDSMIIAMLGIIPVLLLVVPIMIVVRAFGMGRD